MSPLTVVIGGGARSGKSSAALEMARRLGTRPGFVATAQASDDEMAARIAAHRRERGDVFDTVEEPIDLASAFARLETRDVVVVDCLTLWLSNVLIDDPDACQSKIDQLVHALPRLPFHRILVTNEVGLGLVPEHPLGRAFRDHAGRMHRRLAGVADEVYLGAMGILLRLRPAPIEEWRGDHG